MPLARAIPQTLTASPERQIEASEDSLIIARVKAGDVAAFDQIVRKYRERIFGVIYHLTSNREDAADLAQDAFIKAFQAIHRFEENASFFTWLYRIAVNTTLTHLRKARLRSFFSLEEATDSEIHPEWVASLSVQAGVDQHDMVKQLRGRLNEAFQKLSTSHRTVITLFELEGLSHAEIAQIMNCSEGTVRSRLHYAKRLLQAELSDYVR